MREDIKQLLNQRPSWRLHNDTTYQELKQALEIAKQGNNKSAQEELELWIEQRRVYLLEN